MCRNIRRLYNMNPPATDAEVHEASLQFVRKVSGYTQPSQANEAVFEQAVHEVTLAIRRLLDDLVTNAPPRSREADVAKARERAAKRYAT